MLEIPQGIEVGEGDGLTQAQEARAGKEGIARRIHDQGGEAGQCWSERRRRVMNPGGCDHGVTAEGVVGRGGDGGLAAGDDGRGGQEDRRGAAGRRLATKLTTPPSTGSSGLLAVTDTASGLANGVPMSQVCGVLPATSVRVKPWLSKAPMSTAPTRASAPLIGGGCTGAGPGVDGRAAGQKGHGLAVPP